MQVRTLTPDDLLNREPELPTAPKIYQRLNALLVDPCAKSEDFAELVEQDPALTAKLLRVVNSPFFGLRKEVASTAWAISLLGLRELRDIVIAATVINRFRGFDNTMVSMDRFWQKSLRCAVIAKALLTQPKAEDKTESIFVSALLYDIGHLIMYRQIPELMRQTVLEHEATGNPVWHFERRLIGFDYAAVGAALLQRWALPDSLVTPIRYHTEPELAPAQNHQCGIINIAAQMADLESLDAKTIEHDFPASAPIWRIVGLQPANILGLLEQINKRLEGVDALVA